MEKVKANDLDFRLRIASGKLSATADKCGAARSVKAGLINGFEDGWRSAIGYLVSIGAIDVQGNGYPKCTIEPPTR